MEAVAGRSRRSHAATPPPSFSVPPVARFLVVLALCLPPVAECRRKGGYAPMQGRHGIRRGTRPGWTVGFSYRSRSCRPRTVSVAEFGGVGDGVTSNTRAFQSAVDYLAQFASAGGGELYVPPGRWVTGSFNLTNFFTLYLHRDAVILGSQRPRTSDPRSGTSVPAEVRLPSLAHRLGAHICVLFPGGWCRAGNSETKNLDVNEWPLTDPLPSYGRGRDAPGGRFSSLIRGYNLTDVVITGGNGTIDGRGDFWWGKYHRKELNYTRGYLVEIMYSDQILISNLTFVDSPSWNIHPVYSSNVMVKGVTILAPASSPNTDGINPDSCSNVLIEDCYVVSGDDCVAIKSGWDEYGIKVGMPSQHIVIRRLTCISPTSAVIALGSEMSGGIQDVRAEDITAIDSESGVRIKTAVGRGAYVRDVYVRGMNLHTMKWVFWMTGAYGSHPDDGYDRNAIPVIDSISFTDIVAENVTMAGDLAGLQGAPFSDLCISNATINVIDSNKPAWKCIDIQGFSADVSPPACPLLVDQASDVPLCSFPATKLTIEEVELQECSSYV